MKKLCLSGWGGPEAGQALENPQVTCEDHCLPFPSVSDFGFQTGYQMEKEASLLMQITVILKCDYYKSMTTSPSFFAFLLVYTHSSPCAVLHSSFLTMKHIHKWDLDASPQ
jgi:hypothetical protein